MVRIGIDVRLTYYRKGGAAEYMRHLAGGLARLDPDNDYFLLHNFRSVESLIPGNNFRRVNCLTPAHHRLESLLLGLEALPRRLDLLHSPDFIPPRFGAGRYVITVLDLAFLLFENIQTAESLRYYAGQIKRAVRQAAHIIAISQATKEDIMRLLDVPEEKISVTWLGLHPSFTVMSEAESLEKLQPYNLPPEYLLFVGTIEPRKNIPGMLKGYAIAKEQVSDLPKLVLAGQKGWLSEDSFQAIEDLRLSEDVIWLDNVDFAALPALYNRARLHLLPSLYEGFGFPPLEAMACGTPTLVSDRGSLREVSGDAAAYVDPDVPDSVAVGITNLLADETFHNRQREAGLEHVRQFTWEATAQKTLEIYRQVLARSTIP